MSVRSLRRGAIAASRATGGGQSFPASGGNLYLMTNGQLEAWVKDAAPANTTQISMFPRSTWGGSGGGTTVHLLPVAGIGANAIYRAANTGWAIGDQPYQDAVNGRAQWRNSSTGFLGTVTLGAIQAGP